MRYTLKDKKKIAQAQNQIVYEETLMGHSDTIEGYRCKKCRQVFRLALLEVDHIIPRSARPPGEADHPANLQLLCPLCNKKKGNRVKKPAIKKTAKANSSTARKVASRKTSAKSSVKKSSSKSSSRSTTRKRATK